MGNCASNWNKFVLLLWKNWILQWSHKCQLVLELLLPPLFFLLLYLLRHIDDLAVKMPLNIYPEVDMSSLNSYSFGSDVAYSPINPIIDEIVNDVATNAFKNVMKLQPIGYEDAESLENAYKKENTDNFLAGIQFDDSLANIESYPKNIKFALRFPTTLDNLWDTERLSPALKAAGSRDPDDKTGLYAEKGFAQIQHAVSMSFIKLATKGTELPKVSMQRFPYPAHINDSLVVLLRLLLAFIVIISFIHACICITRYVATEKEKQLKEIMKMMGLPNWIHWTAWFVKFFLLWTISWILIVIIVKSETSQDVAIFTHASWTLLLFFFLIYTIASICFCFMIAVFFSRANTAVAVTAIAWFLTFVPYIVLSVSSDDVHVAKTVCCILFSNTGMAYAIEIILGYEALGEGIRWSNVFTFVDLDDNLTLGAIMLMMLASALIYMIICLYVEQVYPGEFGVAKKWYFPCQCAFWCCKKRSIEVDDISNENFDKASPTAFDNKPKGKHAGLKVKDLQKKFGNKWAVKGLTMNMYKDEITVLLGHNGAGKTTTISMLTGIISPTAGTAIINGCDIRTNMEGARKSMSICPQHSVLFDEMSVANHIVFFSRLKGLKGKAVKLEVQKYLTKIELERKANTPTARLSGGMKRKLSLCCALCGDTKVVLCDEPTSGMDPAARRQLWDLMQAEKVGRTILLTTHFMDEADVLGDRIAIMCDGELKCYGTSFALKKQYGFGYRLICVKLDDCDVDKVTNLLQKYIPNIQPASNIGAELTYELPDEFSPVFEKMFSALETESNKLRLNGYGVGVTSLEEVFMKVGAENTATTTDADIKSDRPDELTFSTNLPRTKGCKLLINQWLAMFLKKILCSWRKKILFLLQCLLPILFILAIVSGDGHKDFKLSPMTIGLSQYPSVVSVLEVKSNVKDDSLAAKIAEEYKELVTSYGGDYKCESTERNTTFSDYILKLGETKQPRVDLNYLTAATIDEGNIIAHFNNQPLHAAPLTLNLVHNAIARALMGSAAQITVINAPLPLKTDEDEDRQLTSNSSILTAAFISFLMAFVTAFYILFLIKENQSRAKLLQFLGGVGVFTFWLTHFLWDMLTFIFISLLFVLILACFQAAGYATFEQLRVYFIILLCFGLAALPVTYLFSLWMKDPTNGFSTISVFNIFFGAMLFMVVEIAKGVREYTLPLCRILPHCSLGLCFHYAQVNINSHIICTESKENEREYNCKNIKPYFDEEHPGIWLEILYLLCIGAIILFLVILLEYRICSKIKNCCGECCPSRKPPDTESQDDDVIAEKERILSMSQKEIEAQYLVLDRVTKYYERFLAVNQVSLCVKETECFGLLGVNGAGKTSTFKMMTGDESISSGKAYVKGISLLTNMNKAAKETGYCPQFDALLGTLTGRETLRIFCLLRGVPMRNITSISEQLAQSFGFMKHIDKPIKTYSGGNKRKLSAAIAMLGSPSVIYLDEPTTGMDPAARRQLWNMVCLIRDSGKAIVLTSHSMEECEALCTRLAIMVNGEFKCIGSTQHLKNKFSKGLVLKIKLKSDTGDAKKPKQSIV